MAQIELIMPKMGESVAEATITKWLKEEGDSIEAEESVLEIATDKVDSEVPAPEDGVLKKKLYAEDDVVKVGEVIAIIETEAEAQVEDGSGDAGSQATSTSQPGSNGSEKVNSPEPAAVADAQQMVNEGQQAASPQGGTMEIPRSSGERFYSPLVRSIAQEEGVSLEELNALQGTGSEGRVTKNDILNYLEQRQEEPAPAKQEKAPAAPAASAPAAASKAAKAAPAAPPEPAPQPVSVGGDDEIVEMDRMRKRIADHMVTSKRVSPHVSSFVEADVTNIFRWRKEVKDAFQQREGEKITFTPIFIEALVKTIKDFPGINISVDGDKIIRRKHINVGMAAAMPSGNLIVPVIKDADQLNLVGLTKRVNDLARRARENKLSPDEIQGGTYTITNVGTFGNVMGTPIINQPQVAIMATGSINKKPAVIETPEGDLIGVRYKMFLSHSYDHRVVDGSLGGQFVRRMADYLEAFDPERSW